MFCPKCATQNIDDASFCRSCGANISLVPQALTGQLPTAPADDCMTRRWHKPHEVSMDRAIRSLMMGIAFAVTAVMVFKFSPGGSRWGFWLLIPSMALFGQGFSLLIRLNQRRDKDREPRQMANRSSIENLSAPKTGQLIPPSPSVTEGTTRHLGGEAATRHFDSFENQKPY